MRWISVEQASAGLLRERPLPVVVAWPARALVLETPAASESRGWTFHSTGTVDVSLSNDSLPGFSQLVLGLHDQPELGPTSRIVIADAWRCREANRCMMVASSCLPSAGPDMVFAYGHLTKCSGPSRRIAGLASPNRSGAVAARSSPLPTTAYPTQGIRRTCPLGLR